MSLFPSGYGNNTVRITTAEPTAESLIETSAASLYTLTKCGLTFMCRVCTLNSKACNYSDACMYSRSESEATGAVGTHHSYPWHPNAVAIYF